MKIFERDYEETVKELREIAISTKNDVYLKWHIEDLKCCGNCGNVFYGIEKTSNINESNCAVKICSRNNDFYKPDHVCQYWICDGKTKEERRI